MISTVCRIQVNDGLWNAFQSHSSLFFSSTHLVLTQQYVKVATNQSRVMELGGNVPEHLIEDAMLASGGEETTTAEAPQSATTPTGAKVGQQ
jgi:hypothetical protein